MEGLRCSRLKDSCASCRASFQAFATMAMLPSMPLPPPGLSPPGLPLSPCYLDTLLEPAYVVAASVEATPNDSNEQILPPAEVGHWLLRAASDFEIADWPAYVGDVLKAAAAFESSGPSLPQQDLWMIYRDLINSQGPQYQDGKQQQFPIQSMQRQRKTKTRKPRQSCPVLIATQLNALNDEDPTKVLMLRKINRLGFDSAAILQAHYERYGVVSKVLVSNSHEKQPGQKHRVRPSGLGFILFDSADDAMKALAAGTSQTVAGKEVLVSAFESKENRYSRSGSSGSDMLSGNSEVSEEELGEIERRSSRASSDE